MITYKQRIESEITHLEAMYAEGYDLTDRGEPITERLFDLTYELARITSGT